MTLINISFDTDNTFKNPLAKRNKTVIESHLI